MVVGAFIIGCGVAIITLSNLGTSAMGSTPLVLSYAFQPTMGTFVAAINIVFVVIQLAIARKDFRPYYLLQIPLSLLMGIFTDLAFIIFGWISTGNYLFSMVDLFIGILVLAFGAWLLKYADIVMVPNNMLSLILSRKFNINFGIAVVIIDVLVVLCAIALGLIFFHQLIGVREGTIIAACLTGFFVNGYGSLFEKLRAKSTG